MPTSEDVLINLLIEDKGQTAQKAINSVKTLEGRIQEVIVQAKELSTTLGLSYTQVLDVFRKYNAAVAEARSVGVAGIENVSQINPAALNAVIKSNEAAKAVAEKAREKEIQDELYLAKIDADRAVKEEQATLKRNQSRVQDIEKARELAMQEDTILNKKQQQVAAATKLNTVMEQYAAQLAGITRMIPADQSTTLAKVVPQMAAESGLPINTIMREIQTKFNILPDTIRKSTQEIRQFQNGLQGTLKEVLNLNSILNTAFGVGMAMLIFQLQMAITKFFTDAIQQAKDLSNAIGKISIAEQVMSKGGIDVTGKELLGIVSELEKEFTNVSNVDMLKATGDMALRLAGTGYTPKELKGLLEVANAAKIRNPDRTLEDIMGTVAAAAMSGQVEGVRNLGGGLSVAASDVQAYAKRAGIIQDINDKMTEEQKLHARAGALIEQNNKSLQETLTLQDNLANAGDKLAANWKNLTEKMSPAVDVLNALLFDIAYFIQQITDLVSNWDVFTERLKNTNPLVSILVDSFNRLLSVISALGQMFSPIYLMLSNAIPLYEKLSGKKASEQPSIANLSKQDTPTGPIVSNENANDSENNVDKIKNALNSLMEAMDGFADKAKNMQEDFNISMRKMAEDFAQDTSRFKQDWAIDRAKIIADSNDEIAKKNAEFNQKRLSDEAKFLEDLRQLREKYLMNLDDALHARDARQILRLAREYAMNKTNMINEHNLKQKDDAANHQKEMADLAKQRDDRLKELDAERALQLQRMEEDYKIKKQRAEEEHRIEMQRLEHEKQDKLRQLATSLGEQLKLTDQGMKALYNLYNAYFGPNGYISTLMGLSYANTTQYAAQMAAQIAAMGGSSTPTIPGYSPTGGFQTPAYSNYISPILSGGGGISNRRAKGGLDIANKPTHLIFGEAGPEAALTVPLNKLSNLGSGLFGRPSDEHLAKKLEIEMLLSPDLEARVVSKSLGKVEDAIVNVRRNKR